MESFCNASKTIFPSSSGVDCAKECTGNIKLTMHNDRIKKFAFIYRLKLFVLVNVSHLRSRRIHLLRMSLLRMNCTNLHLSRCCRHILPTCFHSLLLLQKKEPALPFPIKNSSTASRLPHFALAIFPIYTDLE